MDGDEPLPDDLRCKRTDGRDWRCKRRVLDGKSFCGTHLYRGQKTRPPPPSSPPPTKPTPRVRIRVRVKPEPLELDPVSDTPPPPPPVSDTAEAVPDHERCHRNDGRTWRCKKRAMKGQTFCESHYFRAQAQAQKRPRKTAQKESVSVSVSRNVGPVLKVKRKKEKEKEKAAVPEGELRCTRNDGRDWRCKRRVLEGETLCEAHFKGIKLRESGSEGGNVGVETAERRKKRGRTPVPESVRCGKMDGSGEWRCKRQVKDGESLCDFHLKEVKRNANIEIKPELEPEKVKEEGEGEELRCKRTDGRGWRCKRRVLDGKTLCEIHYEQGRLRNKKVTVPESMKIQRGGDGGERVEKRLKRKRSLEALENSSDKGMKRMKAELIRVFLRREIIERSKKSDKKKGAGGGAGGGCCGGESNEEVTRDLPYGLMAIPPAPSTQFLDNAAGSLGVKVGVQCWKSTVNRRFRSKNIEPPPVGAVKVVPYVGNLGKVKSNGRRKCHWCRQNENRTLTQCSSCRKRFFCSGCIKERCIEPQEVKQKCPVCCGSCDCKACCTTRSKVVSTKEVLKEQYKGSKFQRLQYLINYLLPILERINQEQNVELELEAKLKGQNPSEVEIRQAEVGCRDRCCCNNCKSPILDFHRSCPNCSYNLCLSCCREYSQGGSLGGVRSSTLTNHNRIKTHLIGREKCTENVHKSSSAQSVHSTEFTSSAQLLDSTSSLLSCPPMEHGGCDNSHLDLRCIFPLNWTKELEISANEMASDCDSPQTKDDTVHCVFCASISQEAEKSKDLLEASRRTESKDNFLYCPSTSDDHDFLFAHFQNHWRQGQPVKARNVLQGASSLRWDPLAMFCSYLEKGSTNISENVEDTAEGANCSDWYDFEIGVKESFVGSLREGFSRTCYETLKVKAKLSSALSRRLFEGHYGEIIHSLPLQDYTNPKLGLLNLAGKLPEEFPDFKLGPYLCISLGNMQEVARGELVYRLSYNSYDVVDVLAHVTDATCSKEQINKIKRLVKQSNSKGKGDCIRQNLENKGTRMQSEISGDGGVTGASSCSAAATTNGASGTDLRNDKSPAKFHSSDTDSDASMICSGSGESPVKSIDQMTHLDHLESSGISDKKQLSELCGAQWDVFRRQDVPKLIEYIAKHVDELSYGCGVPKNIVHPIFDGSFYLDANHKMTLKEEFDVEPWTFNQCLGEAVFIPAGCPYQRRILKSCVNVAIGFVSPENASECIKLIDEIRVLPNNHKAKQEKLEVEKMAICSIDEAIKEMYRLKIEEKKAAILT